MRCSCAMGSSEPYTSVLLPRMPPPQIPTSPKTTTPHRRREQTPTSIRYAICYTLPLTTPCSWQPSSGWSSGCCYSRGHGYGALALHLRPLSAALGRSCFTCREDPRFRFFRCSGCRSLLELRTKRFDSLGRDLSWRNTDALGYSRCCSLRAWC